MEGGRCRAPCRPPSRAALCVRAPPLAGRAQRGGFVPGANPGGSCHWRPRCHGDGPAGGRLCWGPRGPAGKGPARRGGDRFTAMISVRWGLPLLGGCGCGVGAGLASPLPWWEPAMLPSSPRCLVLPGCLAGAGPQGEAAGLHLLPLLQTRRDEAGGMWQEARALGQGAGSGCSLWAQGGSSLSLGVLHCGLQHHPAPSRGYRAPLYPAALAVC